MSLQVCHCCGWSKATSYQGLRVHQGRMGCTPPGMKIAESEQQNLWGFAGYVDIKMDLKVDVHSSLKTGGLFKLLRVSLMNQELIYDLAFNLYLEQKAETTSQT